MHFLEFETEEDRLFLEDLAEWAKHITIGPAREGEAVELLIHVPYFKRIPLENLDPAVLDKMIDEAILLVKPQSEIDRDRLRRYLARHIAR